MTEKQGLVERGSSFLERLNSREKLLLALMIGLFSAMGGYIVISSFVGSLDEVEEEAALYERALGMLAAHGAGAQEEVERRQRIAEQLQDNQLQLHGFIERECIASSVDRPSSYTDNTIPMRDRDSGEARFIEYETRATIAAVDPLPLSRLLNRIANSDQLVLLKVVEISGARGQPNRYRVDLTVSTFRLAEEEDS